MDSVPSAKEISSIPSWMSFLKSPLHYREDTIHCSHHISFFGVPISNRLLDERIHQTFRFQHKSQIKLKVIPTMVNGTDDILIPRVLNPLRLLTNLKGFPVTIAVPGLVNIVEKETLATFLNKLICLPISLFIEGISCYLS